MARIVSGPEITGIVVDKNTGTPLKGVTVTVNQTVYTDPDFTTGTTTLTTDRAGVFYCYAGNGTYTFTAGGQADSIEPVTVRGTAGPGGSTPGAETVETFTASGSAITLGNPLTAGTMKDVTLTANCTITLPAPAAGVSFLVRLTQDATGGRTATFVLPAGGSPKWGASGVAPAWTVTSGGQDEVAFHSWTGTTWTGGLANKDIR